MPHVIVEYTDNIASEAEIPVLLRTIASKMADSDGIFPLGGIRVRAIRLSEYAIADGEDDYAFVNVTVKIGGGRAEDFKVRFFDEMFDLVKAHFASLSESRYLALSLYVEEFSEQGSWKSNTIHRKFRVA